MNQQRSLIKIQPLEKHIFREEFRVLLYVQYFISFVHIHFILKTYPSWLYRRTLHTVPASPKLSKACNYTCIDYATKQPFNVSGDVKLIAELIIRFYNRHRYLNSTGMII